MSTGGVGGAPGPAAVTSTQNADENQAIEGEVLPLPPVGEQDSDTPPDSDDAYDEHSLPSSAADIIRNSPGYKQAVKDFKEGNFDAGGDHLDSLIEGMDGNFDPLAVMHLVFNDSQKEIQATQHYWVKQMNFQNKLNDSLADQQMYMAGKLTELNMAMQKADDDKKSKVKVKVEEREFPSTHPGTTNGDGSPAAVEGHLVRSADMDKGALEAALSRLDVQVKRAQSVQDRIETNFNGTNTQLNQLNQMRATILRSTNEMRGVGAASRQGL